MEYVITWRDGFLEAKTRGEATVEGIAEMISGVVSHEKWEHGGALLVDHSELNAGPLTLAQIRSLADMAAEAGDRVGPARIAHAVSRDLEFGLVRMWESFVSLQWEARLKVFRSRDEAIAWLKEPE